MGGRGGRRGAGSAAAAHNRIDPRGVPYRYRPQDAALSRRTARVEQLERSIVKSTVAHEQRARELLASHEQRARALLASIRRAQAVVEQGKVVLCRRDDALREREQLLSRVRSPHQAPD
jgi:uncharacterized protein (DUF3084 family)